MLQITTMEFNFTTSNRVFEPKFTPGDRVFETQFGKYGIVGHVNTEGDGQSPTFTYDVYYDNHLPPKENPNRQTRTEKTSERYLLKVK